MPLGWRVTGDHENTPSASKRGSKTATWESHGKAVAAPTELRRAIGRQRISWELRF